MESLSARLLVYSLPKREESEESKEFLGGRAKKGKIKFEPSLLE